MVSFFLSSYNGDDIGTHQHEDARNGLVPGEHVLSEPDGHERGDDGLQVGIDGDRGGLQILHGEWDEEIAEGGGADHDERHLEDSFPAPRPGVEGIHRQFRKGDGNGDDGGDEEHVFHLRDGRILRRHITRDDEVDGPGEYAQDGERDADEVVFARTQRLTHQHHQYGTRDAQQHTQRLHGGDLLADGECGADHHGHRCQRGDEREIDGTGVVEGPRRQRL